MQDDKKDLNIFTEELNKLRQEVQSLRTDIKNINVRFQQLQKSIDGQKLNHRLYFDNIENSLASLKIMLEDILSPKISAIEKSIDAESNSNSIISKNISSLEELMRLIVANQMLNNLEIKTPTPKPKEIIQGRAKIYAVGGFLYAEMLSGQILSNSKIKVIRSGKTIFNTSISYLNSFHQGSQKITGGYFQCQLAGVNNYKIDKYDIIEAYTLEW